MNNSKPAILGGAKLFDPILNLVIPDLPPFSELQPGYEEMLSTGMVTKGRFLQELEAVTAEYSGAKHAIGVSSCTMGIVLVHRLLNLTGEIILPSFTFMASALGCVWNQVTPVFVDVDAHTFNIDPRKVEEAISERTTAIIATHVFGNPAAIEELEKIANKHKLKLIFDAAHGFGAQYKGQPLGAHGDCEIFSCSPTKLLICGEGGIVTTNDDELAFELKRSREYGNVGNYDLHLPGLNGRLSEANALMGLKSFGHLERVASQRNAAVVKMKELLQDVPGISWQKVEPGNRSSYKDLSYLIDETEFGLSRDQLVTALEAEGIVTRNYYDPPCHLQTYWLDKAKIGPSGLAVTEKLSAGSVTLPLSSKMTDEQFERMADAVKRIQSNAPAIRTKSGAHKPIEVAATK